GAARPRPALGGLVGRTRLEERPHPLRDRFVEHIIVERVEKGLSVRSAFEEIQDLFLDRIGGSRLRNVTTSARWGRKIACKRHNPALYHNRSQSAGVHGGRVSLC